MTKFSEDMSIRFLKREAKLCSFLQKCFLAMEQVRAWAVPSSSRIARGVWGGGSPRFTTASAVSTENEVFRELTSDGRKQPSRGTGKPLAEAT